MVRGLCGALNRYTAAATITSIKTMARYLCSASIDGALYSNLGLGTKLLGPLPPPAPGAGSGTARAGGFAGSKSAFQYIGFESPLA